MASTDNRGDGPDDPEKTVDGAPPDPTAPEGYKVGPRCPPIETRWKKGCRSPNPAGRPAKKRTFSMLDALDPFYAAIRQHGEHEVKLRNDTSTTRVSANLDAIFKQSLQGSARASALYHQIQEAAAAEQDKLIQIAVRGALLHQETHLEKFLECERLGRPLPNVFPDPRDIFIEDDGVRIVGPVTLADKLRDDQLLADRENIVECWLENEQMGASADYISKEKRKLNKFYKLIEEDLSIKHRMPLDLIIRKIRQKHKKEDARYAAEDKEADD